MFLQNLCKKLNPIKENLNFSQKILDKIQEMCYNSFQMNLRYSKVRFKNLGRMHEMELAIKGRLFPSLTKTQRMPQNEGSTLEKAYRNMLARRAKEQYESRIQRSNITNPVILGTSTF